MQALLHKIPTSGKTCELRASSRGTCGNMLPTTEGRARGGLNSVGKTNVFVGMGSHFVVFVLPLVYNAFVICKEDPVWAISSFSALEFITSSSQTKPRTSNKVGNAKLFQLFVDKVV